MILTLSRAGSGIKLWGTLANDLPRGFRRNGQDFILLVMNFKIISIPGDPSLLSSIRIEEEMNTYYNIADAKTLKITQEFINCLKSCPFLFKAFWQMPYK